MVVILLTLQGVSQAVVSRGRLTDEQVNAAIQRGNHDKRSHRIGLTLVDQQEFFLSGLLCTTCQTSGYVITIYTPEQWIEQAARYARREMAPFTIADVPEEMREQTLHVVAMPSTPAYLNGNGFSWASSVHRVVLSDTSRAITIQPVALSHGSIETNSAFRSASFISATVSFFMADVERLRAADPKGEFFIVVVGDNKNKFFKVKTRYMSELFPTGYAQSYSQSYSTNSQPVAPVAAENSSSAAIQSIQQGATMPSPTSTPQALVRQQESRPTVAAPQEVIVDFRSTPTGADIRVDGSYVGSTPSSISISPGEHTIKISKKDFRSYERTLTLTDQNLKVAAYLQQVAVRFDH
jgi:hypothetical protein